MGTEVVEQTGQTDSTGDVDAKLDRLFPPDQEENQQSTQEQGEEQATEQTTEVAESQPTETQEALEEIDLEGERFHVPSKFKAAFMRQDDYTRKTQAIAERERMVALTQQRQQLEQAFQQSVQEDQTSLHQLEAAIKQYDAVNWPQLDMETYIKTKHSLESLEKQRDKAKAGIDAKREKFGKEVNEVHQHALQKANEVLSRQIPKWGPEVQKEIMSYGQAEGYTDVELGSIRDPRVILSLYKAQQWDKLQAGKSLAAKRASGVPPVLKPGATKPVASATQTLGDTVKQLHQAKDPVRKKDLFDKALDLKLSRMLK